MTWFETLTGFRESSPEFVRSNLVLEGTTITSKVNDRRMICGRLEMPTLGELRNRTAADRVPTGALHLSEIIGNVQHLHMDSANAEAVFQVASQFNLLEMVGPSHTPEEGIGIYEFDRTQGPACAIAAGAGTIYRNYYAPVNGRIGQTIDNQIDCLYDLGQQLGNTDGRLWNMQNGYALLSREGLEEVDARIRAMDEQERDALRAELRIGLHWNTEVTLGESNHTVSQTYCSALPVGYSPHPADLWAAFGQLILEASYEATFHAALLNLLATGNNTLYLTLLGGGAFGNREEWIFAALRRAMNLFSDTPLRVAVMSYGSSKAEVRGFVEEHK